MRAFLVASLAVVALLAGCSDDDGSSTASCSDEYRQAFERANEEHRNATGEDLVDTDGDCVPDDAETQLGTDPRNATDVPDLVDLDQGNGTNPPVVVHGPATATVSSAVVVATGGAALAFNVEEGATAIFAEIRWDDPVQDLNLALASPNAGTTQGAQNYDHVQEGGAPGSPDSPHSLALTGGDVVPGDWQASAFATGAAAEVSYEVVVSVFYGATAVPDGYTAFT